MTRKSGTSKGIQRRILVVDNEESVRMTMLLMMRVMGFKVQAAGSGEEAVKLFEENDFDVVFADPNITGTDGSKLARNIKEISPWTLVVSMAEDTRELIRKRAGKSFTDTAFLKPLMLQEVKKDIERLLG